MLLKDSNLNKAMISDKRRSSPPYIITLISFLGVVLPMEIKSLEALSNAELLDASGEVRPSSYP